MTQTRRASAIEAAANTAAGFVVSWLTGLVAYPLLGLHVTQAQNIALIAIFTVASLLRGYTIRRLFNSANIRAAVAHSGQVTPKVAPKIWPVFGVVTLREPNVFTEKIPL